MIPDILLFFSSAILGVFLGAQIVEAVLFVPYWKSLSADDFFEFYNKYGKKIHHFFAPLTIAATVIPIFTVSYYYIYQTENQLLLWLIGLSTFAFFSTYFIYFKKANMSFVNKSMANEKLPNELIKWRNWHILRIFFETVAFICSLILLYKFK